MTVQTLMKRHVSLIEIVLTRTFIAEDAATGNGGAW